MLGPNTVSKATMIHVRTLWKSDADGQKPTESDLKSENCARVTTSNYVAV